MSGVVDIPLACTEENTEQRQLLTSGSGFSFPKK